MKRNTLTEAYKYAIVGGICTVLDFGILYILTKFGGVDYLFASIFSFMFGTILNYQLCTQWIFKVRLVKKHNYEFILYTIITGVGLAINTLLIWTFTEYLALYFMISKVFASFTTYFWNFGARKFFLHTEKIYKK